MGYTLTRTEFDQVLSELGKNYRLYAPVLKIGQGRFTDTDVVIYDFISESSEIELEKKSDFSFKEILTPLSQTLFFFTENVIKEADIDCSDAIIFLRSCDMHAVKRLDQIYLNNGKHVDPFYKKVRDHVKFVLIGCPGSFQECFCVSMGTNKTDEGYLFALNYSGDQFDVDVKDAALNELFEKAGAAAREVTVDYVTENETKVTIPEKVPNRIYQSDLWKEYDKRCVACGRCNLVCPTCTCFTMQDAFYTDNGKVGERRRVGGSCMIDGYSTVAGGGQYRRKHGERMRFKVLHKIYDFRKRYGYDMCVGCGRCDDVCPEYISFSNIINKVNAEVKEGE
jgi:anaerobic sulfite reductase subunit A